jgi:hypothetical protein
MWVLGGAYSRDVFLHINLSLFDDAVQANFHPRFSECIGVKVYPEFAVVLEKM